jgi:hypothetical protein
MIRGWVDYRAVKAAVPMEVALVSYGIRLHRLNRDYLRGRCPLPAHTSESSRQSFIVNIARNAWACHSDSCVAARGGGSAATCWTSSRRWSTAPFARQR